MGGGVLLIFRPFLVGRIWGFLRPDCEVLSILPHRGVHHREFFLFDFYRS